MDSLALDVADWAAILYVGAVERLGAAGDPASIPARHRRRLPPFPRDVVCCAMPLLRGAPQSDIILSAPYGDLASTVELLEDMARREILSPTQFSLSVHNAPAGVLSLCINGRTDHTAISAGQATLAAGLTEAYARLATKESSAVVLVHADDRLPPVYSELDDDAPGVFLAMQLSLTSSSSRSEGGVAPGRAGAVALAHKLVAGVRRVRFAYPQLKALAA